MKVARHEKIIELIRQYEIDTQEELAARLNEAGFKVTQATVSRDIRALKMTKVAGSNGKSRYAILEEHGAIYPVKGKGNFVSEKDKVTDRMKGQCFGRLKETVDQAKKLGINEEEFSIKVRTYYREGKHD